MQIGYVMFNVLFLREQRIAQLAQKFSGTMNDFSNRAYI